MANRTATLTARLIDDISGPAKGAAGALKGLGASASDLNKLGAANPKLGKLLADLERLKAAQKGIGDYRDAGRSWMDLGKRLRSTQDEIKQTLTALDQAKKKVASYDGMKSFSRGGAIAKEMADARKEVVRLESTYKNLQRDAAGVAAAFEKQGQATRGLKAGLVSAGVSLKTFGSAEGSVKASIAGVNAELSRQSGLLSSTASKAEALARANRSLVGGMGAVGRSQMQRVAASRRMLDGMGSSSRGGAGSLAGGAPTDPGRPGIVEAAAGLGAGAVLKNTYERARTGWLEMDEASRRQNVILGLGAGQQEPLYRQALKIGQDTRFSNPDVVKAQTRIGSSLPDHLKNPEVIKAITENSKNYALAMGTTMDQASEAILGRMLGLRMDMSTPEAAASGSKDAANKLVQFAKSSGADHNDVMGYTKFGAAPGSVGGFSPEFADAMAAQLRRIGYEGSMAGNFVRASATRLAVPSSKGLGVLAAAGINHSDYVAPGKELSAGNLNSALKLKFGKSLSDKQQARIQKLMQDEEVVGNREEFVPQVSEIIQETLARKTKKGKIHAQDAERIAKSVNDYLSAAAGAVDIQRLQRDVIAKGLTPAMAKYLFGQEHGGRAQALDLKTLDKDTEAFRNTPADRAEKVGTEINAGAYGAYQRMIGSVETFYMRLGQVADGPLTRLYDVTGNVVDRISNLPDGALQAGTALTALAGAALMTKGVLGAFNVAKAAMGVGGAAAAAGSATALGGSARAGALFGMGGLGLPVLGAGAAAGALYFLSDEEKGLTHGGRPDVTMNPSDELPGLSGSTDAPSWKPTVVPRQAVTPLPPNAPAVSRGPEFGALKKVPLPPERPKLFGGTPVPQLDEAKRKADELNATTIAPKGDGAGLAPLGTAADEAKAKLSALAGVSVAPTVDASSITAAESAVDRLLAKIARVGPALAGASGAAASGVARTGNVAQRLQNARTDTGM
jgi:TP901 family phage tail tape measure protein